MSWIGTPLALMIETAVCRPSCGCQWPRPALSRSKIRIRLVTCGSSGCQAARAYSLIRPPRPGFRWIRSRSRSVTVTWPPSCSPSGTRWAMPWCGLGGVVVRLVFGQDGAQTSLAEDQHAVQELAAQGAGEALADRVHPRRL